MAKREISASTTNEFIQTAQGVVGGLVGAFSVALLISCSGPSPGGEVTNPAPALTPAEAGQSGAVGGGQAAEDQGAESGASPQPAPPSAGEVAEVAEVDAAAVEPRPGDPAALYAECRDRVEGREKDGECSTDADCAPAGCSGEVCVTKTLAPEVMTTCEQRPCFTVLDTCGCVEGRCSWSVVEEMPSSLLPDGGQRIENLPTKDVVEDAPSEPQ